MEGNQNDGALANQRFNVFIKTQMRSYSLLDLSRSDLDGIVVAFDSGEADILLDGKKYFIQNIWEIRVYTHDQREKFPGNSLLKFCVENRLAGSNLYGTEPFVPLKVLDKFGQDVTRSFITGKQGGLKLKASTPADGHYVDLGRLNEIEKLASGQFDFSKLLQLLRELNMAHAHQSLLSIPMLVRAIIDHVPPVFGKSSFAEVCGAYGSKSFKDSMNNLDKSRGHLKNS
ncbi:MAG: hypothetical protein KIT10_13950 [Flavobacteriales bacterium]|nr:hypothetical protein [Flavobacteriales bacterium]